MNDDDAKSDWPPHIIAVYQEQTTQLRYLKRQQWMIVNYLLVLLGGLFGLVHAVGSVPGSVRCGAIAITALAVILAIALLGFIQPAMKTPRDILAKIHDRMEIEHVLGLPKTPTSCENDWPFLLALILTCLSGGAFVAGAIWFFQPPC